MPFIVNPFKKHDAKDFDVLVDLADAKQHPSHTTARDRNLADSAEGKSEKDVEPARASDALNGYTMETLQAEIELGMLLWLLALEKSSWTNHSSRCRCFWP